MHTGKVGGNTGSVETSTVQQLKNAMKRKQQEKRWAAKSGPVTVIKEESK